jgi:succinyl-CoA synthetase beta subunit
MKIHEYQGKEILKKFGVTVPRGIPCFSVDEAVKAAETLGGKVWVVKAQIHAGGRGKGGGVKVAKSMDEVRAYAGQILGMQLVTHQTGPRRPEGAPPADRRRRRHQEGILRCRADRPRDAEGGHDGLLSEGGMDIEEVAHKTPEKIIKVFVDPATGLTDAQAKRTGRRHRRSGGSQAQAIDTLKKLYTCYMETDASLAEINPLILEGNGNIKALDAKFNFDSNALYRHPEIVAYRDLDEEDADEIEASKFDLAYISARRQHRLPGQRRRPGHGDHGHHQAVRRRAGQLPRRRRRRHHREGHRSLQDHAQEPQGQGHPGQHLRRHHEVRHHRQGVVAAAKETHLSVPLVVRMKGTNEDLGKKILKDSGLPIISADTMAEAATKIVAAVK